MADLNIVIAAHTGQATSEINKVRSGLQSLDGQMKKSARGNNVYGAAVSENTRGLSKFAKSGLQQTGYQVGDFAVQVGGGTSALQAFGQQGSQLFGIFGAGGAIFGAVIAVVAAVGNAFLKGAEKAQDFGSATEDLTTATNNFKRSVDLTFIESIEEKYGKVTESVTKLVNVQRVLQQVQEKAAFKKVQSTLTETVATFDKVIERQRRLTSLGSDLARPYLQLASQFGDSTKSIGEEFGLASEMLGAFGRKIEAVASSSTKQQLQDNVAAVLTFIAQNGGATTDAMIDLKASMDQLVLSGLALGDVPMKAFKRDAKEVNLELERATQRTKDMAEATASSFGAAFTDIVMGTKRTKDAFASMASSIIDQLFQILIVQRLVGTVGSTSSTGVVTRGTGIAGFFKPKAIGGPVQGNSTYLVGERGPELLTMGARGGNITPNNQIGGSGVTVNNNLTINSDNASAVRNEVLSMLPMIKEASKSAVLEASRRGGSFANSFGN